MPQPRTQRGYKNEPQAGASTPREVDTVGSRIGTRFTGRLADRDRLVASLRSRPSGLTRLWSAVLQLEDRSAGNPPTASSSDLAPSDCLGQHRSNAE